MIVMMIPNHLVTTIMAKRYLDDDYIMIVMIVMTINFAQLRRHRSTHGLNDSEHYSARAPSNRFFFSLGVEQVDRIKNINKKKFT